MSTDTALVVIDAQIGVVGEAYHHDEVLENIQLLLGRPAAAGRPFFMCSTMNKAGWSQGCHCGRFTRQ